MDGELEKGRVDRKEDAPPPILSGNSSIATTIPIKIETDRDLDQAKNIFRRMAEDFANVSVGVFSKGRRATILIQKLLEKPTGEVFSRLDSAHSSLNDRLSKPSLRYNDLSHDVGIIENKSPEYTDGNEVTMVFLPGDTSIEEAKGYGFIPKWGKAIVFTTPGGFVNCDPAKTKQVFLDVIRDAKREVEEVLKVSPTQKINVISYSAANGAGYYTANNLLKKENQGRFTSVATGSGLGREIFGSTILKEIMKDAAVAGITDGYDFNKDFYDQNLNFFYPNPMPIISLMQRK